MSLPNTYDTWIDALNQRRVDHFVDSDAYEKLEAIARTGESALFAALKKQSVDEVGALLLSIPERYPLLRKYLPSMAAPEVQKHWTGEAGVPLLYQSIAFVRSVREGFHRYTDQTLDGLSVLDYGCGWGRLLRLMLAVTGPENLFGCDPWDKSIEACDGHHIRANIALSEYLPTDLPFANCKFNLIYAFSVFTHLSERAATAALTACRKHIREDGLMAITIRPMSYWDVDGTAIRLGKVDELKRKHADEGFAFSPHIRETVDGEVTYGDTSMSLDFINKRWPEWEVVGTDRVLTDVMQTIIFLKPR